MKSPNLTHVCVGNICCCTGCPCWKVLKLVTWGRQSRIEQRMCERRGACEPAVEYEEAGAIAEDERSEDCLLNYLCRGRKASLIYMRQAFY